MSSDSVQTDSDSDSDQWCCPVCLLTNEENHSLIDNMQNHEFDGCKHFICISCIQQMYEHDIVSCPVCRGDITRLVYWTRIDDHEKKINELELELEREQDDNKRLQAEMCRMVESLISSAGKGTSVADFIKKGLAADWVNSMNKAKPW
jgi:hypothetical protein